MKDVSNLFANEVCYIENINEFVNDLNKEGVSLEHIQSKYKNVYDVLNEYVLNYDTKDRDNIVDLTAFNDLNVVGLQKALTDRSLCCLYNVVSDITHKCTLTENQRLLLFNNCFENTKDLLLQIHDNLKSVCGEDKRLHDLDYLRKMKAFKDNNLSLYTFKYLCNEFFVRLNICLDVMYADKIKDVTSLLSDYATTLKDISLCLGYTSIQMSLHSMLANCTDEYIDDLNELLGFLVNSCISVRFVSPNKLTDGVLCSQYLLKVVSSNTNKDATKLMKLLCLIESFGDVSADWYEDAEEVENDDNMNLQSSVSSISAIYALWDYLLNQSNSTRQIYLNSLSSFCSLLKNLNCEKPLTLVLDAWKCSDNEVGSYLEVIHKDTGVLVIISEEQLNVLSDSEPLTYPREAVYHILRNQVNIQTSSDKIKFDLYENNECIFEFKSDESSKMLMLELLKRSTDVLSKVSIEYLNDVINICDDAIENADLLDVKYYLQLTLVDLYCMLMNKLKTLKSMKLSEELNIKVSAVYREASARLLRVMGDEILTKGAFLVNRRLLSLSVNDELLRVLEVYTDINWSALNEVDKRLLISDIRTYDLYSLGRFADVDNFEKDVLNTFTSEIAEKLLKR